MKVKKYPKKKQYNIFFYPHFFLSIFIFFLPSIGCIKTKFSNNASSNTADTLPSSLNPHFQNSFFQYTIGQTVSITPFFETLLPSSTTFFINPSLPNGLTLDTTSGNITGVANALLPQTTYTISAQNNQKISVSSFTLSLMITDTIRSITYPQSQYTFTANTSMPTLSPTLTGTHNGAVENLLFSVSSITELNNLGIFINPSTGSFFGVPHENGSNSTFTITATDATGKKTSTSITFIINSNNPSITSTLGSGQSVIAGNPLLIPLSVTVENESQSPLSGQIVNWTIIEGNGSLGSASNTTNALGVATNTVTFTSSGTGKVSATLASNNTSFIFSETITANTVNTSTSRFITSSTLLLPDNTSTATLTITLQDAYNNPIIGKAISIVSSRGATDTITTLVGTTNSSGQASFTVKSLTPGSPIFTATDTTDSITLGTVLVYFLSPPSLSETQNTVYFTVNVNSVFFSVVNTGGAITSCSISPSLPAGLTLNPTTCDITGPITNTIAPTSYTITASNLMGTDTKTITLLSVGLYSVNNSGMCGITETGGLQCWGPDGNGQLGDGGTITQPAPVAVQGLSGPVTQVALLSTATCALLASGNVQCWGDNSSGQLGNNGISGATVQGITGSAVSIAASDSSICCINSSGGVQCWGNNSSGQLGNNSTTNSNTAVNVTGLSSSVTQLGTTYYNNGSFCALTPPNTVQCWGFNGDARIGNGTTNPALTPSAVIGLSSGTIVQLSQGGGDHICALFSSGLIQCWGRSYYGQLGNQTSTGNNIGSAVPVNVGVLADNPSSIIPIQISAGNAFTCVLMSSGTIQCWGANNLGQFGIGGTPNIYMNVATSTQNISSGVSQIICSVNNLTCALFNTGSMKCWGDNTYGQLGIGTLNTTQLTTPPSSNIIGLP